MTPAKAKEDQRTGLDAGYGSARDYVLRGAPWGSGVRPFRALYDLGMRETDDVLDFGCGALRVGRFLIMYLEPHHYFGIDPSEWAVSEGLSYEVGTDLAALRRPRFKHPPFDTFDASLFGEQRFDWVLFSGVLTHMDHRQLAESLGTAVGVLKPGGRIVGSYLPTGGPDHDGVGWLYPQQAVHSRGCIERALGTFVPMTVRDIDVPGDPAQWFDAWFVAS